MQNPAEDPSRLRAEQYHTDANLRARMGLHQRFSTNLTGRRSWLPGCNRDGAALPGRACGDRGRASAAIRMRGAFHITKDVGLLIAQVAT